MPGERAGLHALLRNPEPRRLRCRAQTHANPDVSFAGVMPLHLAVEEGFVDMAAYLMHWGANKTAVDGSRKTPLMYAQARLKAKKTKDDPNSALLVQCVRRARAWRRGCTAQGC